MFFRLYRVRFHYGHPDIFDRIFHITRGGISKASKIINLSEDIFAGNFRLHLVTILVWFFRFSLGWCNLFSVKVCYSLLLLVRDINQLKM